MANIGALAQQLKDRFEIPVGIREVDSRDRFASGLGDIDKLLQGGFPRATLSEITGSASSNRTALTVSTLARALGNRRVRRMDRRQWNFRPGVRRGSRPPTQPAALDQLQGQSRTRSEGH